MRGLLRGLVAVATATGGIAALNAPPAHAALCIPSVLRICAPVLPPILAPVLPVCHDGRDNDRDGAVDHPADLGCLNPEDGYEGDDLAPDIGGDANLEVDPRASARLFGFNGAAPDGITVEQDAALARQAGSGVRRIPVHWRSRQLAPGLPLVNMAGLDAQVAALHAQGIRPILTLLRAPTWASCSATDLRCHIQVTGEPAQMNRAPAPDYIENFAAFGEAVAARYAYATPIIEGWNEPNMARYWKAQSFPQPSLMADLQCTLYRRIRMNPGLSAVRVLSPGVLGLEDIDVKGKTTYMSGLYDFLAEMYGQVVGKYGVGSCWDGMAFHDYSGVSYDGANSRSARIFRIVRNFKARYGDPTPIWITETGATTGDVNGADVSGGMPAMSEQTQCDVVNRTLNEYLTTPDIAAVVAHNLYDGGDGEEYGYGWLRASTAFPPPPKLVWSRFAARGTGVATGC